MTSLFSSVIDYSMMNIFIAISMSIFCQWVKIDLQKDTLIYPHREY